MVELAEKARRNGLLALEEDVAKIDDAYTRRASSWSSTAPTPTSSRAILESEVDGMAARHHAGAPGSSRPPAASPRRSASSAPSWAWSTCSRTCRRRPTLGPAISGAFIATLYGVVEREPDLPADRQQAQGDVRRSRSTTATMMLEAILSIQAGDNPRVLAEKLETFVAAGRARQQRRRRARSRPSAELTGGGMSGGSGRGRRRRGAAATAAAATRAATSAGSSPTPT